MQNYSCVFLFYFSVILRWCFQFFYDNNNNNNNNNNNDNNNNNNNNNDNNNNDNNNNNNNNREIVDSIVNMMKEDNVEAPKGFKKIERSKLDQEIKKVNQAIDFIQTSTISDTNRLIATVATYVGQKVGLKVKENRPERSKEPFWKRRIRKKIDEIRKHIKHIISFVSWRDTKETK